MSEKRTSAAQLLAVARYQSKHIKQYVVKLHRTHDADLVEMLEAADSKAGMIKEALRLYKKSLDKSPE